VRGANRHRSFAVPVSLGGAPTLRLRVRVNAVRYVGTFSAARPEGVALGSPRAIADLEELTTGRTAQLPKLRTIGVTNTISLGISLLTLLIFVLDRRRREFGWYTLALLSNIGEGFLYAGHLRGAEWHGPVAFAAQVTLSMASLSTYFKLLTVMLRLRGKLVTAAVLLPWAGVPLAVVALMAPDVFISSPLVLPVFGGLLSVVCPLVGLALLIQGWRARRPDARALTCGYGAYLALSLTENALILGGGNITVGGWQADLRVLLSMATSIAFFGTTAVILALRYHRAFHQVEQAYQASERFVPAAFLRLLGREHIVAVERGDSQAQPMTVMFSDIRGFTARSEHRDPAEVFAFINRYLERMEPHITDSGGFINQYFGDGIMALFPTADGALEAARAMQREVEAFSAELDEQGEPGLRVGVGLHTGSLVLGTLGGSSRLDTNVIGDAVNLSARIEGMTKQYGCRVLLSEATLEALEAPDEFPLREVDTNRAVGRAEPMKVLQLLDAEDDATRSGIQAVAERFARGLADYRQGAFEAAQAAFDDVLAEVDDGPARWLRDRCQRYLAQPPADWDGVTLLDSK